MTLKDLLSKYKYDYEFIYENLKFDLSEQLKKMMEDKGFTKKELAEKMGVSPSYVTKIFGADNISLKTVAKVLAALEVDATIRLINPNKMGEIKVFRPKEAKEYESDTLLFAS
ncbi:helix-turn-helix domain-containing protein [Desulfurobacterium sp.]